MIKIIKNTVSLMLVIFLLFSCQVLTEVGTKVGIPVAVEIIKYIASSLKITESQATETYNKCINSNSTNYGVECLATNKNQVQIFINKGFYDNEFNEPTNTPAYFYADVTNWERVPMDDKSDKSKFVVLVDKPVQDIIIGGFTNQSGDTGHHFPDDEDLKANIICSVVNNNKKGANLILPVKCK